ncbi:MAG: hypothetical protein IKC64_04225 [Clostridia bacterium]|nr:hypothetical protein [Clostridia bacterium]
MAIVWYLTVFSGCVALLFINPDLALKSMLDGAQNSVDVTIKLVASYGFWLGFFALVDKIGLANKINFILRPVVRFLFPKIKPETEKFVTLNLSANLIGLGNASTPLAVSAINSMYEGKDYASTNMIMLTVISATSLQLVPTTVIGLRTAHGSAFPTAFLLPSVIATTCSTALGIIGVKLLSKILPTEPKKAPLFSVKSKRQRAK